MAAGRLATEPPGHVGAELTGTRGRGWPLVFSPYVAALAVSVPLAVAYLVLAPSSGDLAAATYRGDPFARAGFTL